MADSHEKLSSTPLTVIHTATVFPGKLDEVLSLTKAIREESTANVKGLLKFDIYQYEDSLVFVESFADEAALKEHYAGKAFKHYVQEFRKVQQPPVSKWYNTVE